MNTVLINKGMRLIVALTLMLFSINTTKAQCAAGETQIEYTIAGITSSNDYVYFPSTFALIQNDTNFLSCDLNGCYDVWVFGSGVTLTISQAGTVVATITDIVPGCTSSYQSGIILCKFSK